MTELTTAPTGAPLADADIFAVRKGSASGLKQITALEMAAYFGSGGSGGGGVISGTYTGDGAASQSVSLSSSCEAVLITSFDSSGSLGFVALGIGIKGVMGARLGATSAGAEYQADDELSVAADGNSFAVSGTGVRGLNNNSTVYNYIGLLSANPVAPEFTGDGATFTGISVGSFAVGLNWANVTEVGVTYTAAAGTIEIITPGIYSITLSYQRGGGFDTACQLQCDFGAGFVAIGESACDASNGGPSNGTTTAAILRLAAGDIIRGRAAGNDSGTYSRIGLVKVAD